MNQNFEILDSLIDSIALLNNKGEIMFTNKAWKKFLLDNAGEISKADCYVNYLEVCHKVDGEEFENAKQAADGIQTVIAGNCALFEMEYACHSDDIKRWFIMRVTPLATNDNLTIVAHINITNRKILEQETEIQNKKIKLINERLETTLLRITHDIQGPIASIEGLINLTKLDDEKQELNPYFAMIETSISNLGKYIQDTLDFSATKKSVELISFKELIDTYLESIKHVGAAKFINITATIEQVVNFNSYKPEIVSILSNIINNSLKYYDTKKPEKFIRITILVSEFVASISIVDNGIGINSDQIPQIFDLNFQINKNSGAGIGLHLVKKSVSMLHGTIQVNSTFGNGTEFNITIPNIISVDK